MVSEVVGFHRAELTSNAGEQLPGKTLYLAAGKGHETIAFEEVEDALTK